MVSVFNNQFLIFWFKYFYMFNLKIWHLSWYHEISFLVLPYTKLVLCINEKERFKTCWKYSYVFKKIQYIEIMMCRFNEWSNKIYNWHIWNLLVRYELPKKKKNSEEWSVEMKTNSFLFQCMLRWFQTGPFFTTGHRRVINNEGNSGSLTVGYGVPGPYCYIYMQWT